MITGFADFPDESKSEKELFVCGVRDFVSVQSCPGGIRHYQQINLTLLQQEGRTWTVMETPNHSSLLEQVGSWDGCSQWW